ncbi:MAG: stalk domain-containing protein, partial [Firmicutes bacterium]|nr:stalk domain-containing protein [Bacillota bacterium]
ITLDPQADIATALDTPVPAELTNGRAYVPLKFLAETFGKEASYDPETETIELIDQIADLPAEDPLATKLASKEPGPLSSNTTAPMTIAANPPK